MAKRKRLTPAQQTYLSAAEQTASGPAAAGAGLAKGVSVGAAPIAQVASDTSAAAALQELSGVLENARARGLMIEELSLDAIDETYLVRDRIVQDEEDMQSLMDSIRARGQQTPIEVVRRDGAPGVLTHGLISGWRRLTALRRLYAETSESRFATVKALIVRPDSAADAYLAMVEENEIRVNLSHYERARIAMRALAEGVYPDQRKALLGLFLNVPRAKRSKIASFVTVVQALDAVLRYPTAIPEKLGLSLARLFEDDPSAGPALADRLRAARVESVAEELTLLQGALLAQNKTLLPGSEPDLPAPAPLPAAPLSPAKPRLRSLDPVAAPGERISLQAAPGVRLAFTADQHKIELSGDGVTADLMAELKAWLATR
ncbi:ParB/RepB/Spo0J family partition protein [Tritonibacter horizontis]|uniref:ParB-like nuclease domain protein n=1 Tax=Tritonibacter horizontis TaxID=1768241 RepID=A0A132BZ24_9RHOB|nr:ParB N-terminal domain-containing protein [Tritonibacter horizontis]KUP93544.1 ParB-like nuclease domain protein [Tritonibacter horizontis]